MRLINKCAIYELKNVACNAREIFGVSTCVPLANCVIGNVVVVLVYITLIRMTLNEIEVKI